MLFETHANNLFHNQHGAPDKLKESPRSGIAGGLPPPQWWGGQEEPRRRSSGQSLDRQHHLPPHPACGQHPARTPASPAPQHHQHPTGPRAAAEVTLRGKEASPGWSCSSSQPSTQEPGAHRQRSLSCGGTTAAVCSMKCSRKPL